jgi:dCTP deaminase
MATLSDTDIATEMAAGNLVHGGEKSQIGPACYELRMGTVYYDLTEGDRRIDATTSNTVLIKPGHRVVLITQEELAVPNNMIARVTSKGSLFSVGLSPVSTYGDPGFVGNLGIVTQNLSDKYLVLPVGEPIAKVDFSLLSSPSQKPYQGQHGFQTEIWPIKHHLQKNYQEIKDDPRVESEGEEAYKILPRAVADIVKQVNRKQRLINAAMLATLVLNTFVLAALSTKYLEPIMAVATNLISSSVVAILIWSSDVRSRS